MAASYGGFGTASVGTGTRSPGIPANTDTTDVSLMIGRIGTSGTRSVGPSGGNGTWANEISSVNGSGTLYVDYKVCTSDDAEPPATYSVGGNAIQSETVVTLRIDGANNTDPISATNVNTGASSTSAAVLLTGGSAPPAGSCLVWFYVCQAANVTCNTPPSGMTLRSGAGSQQIHWATIDNWGGGDTASLTATMSAGAAHRVVLIALPPASTTISPSGIDSSATLGTPVVQPGSLTVSPGGIAGATALGTPTVTTGSVTVSPSGIDSTAALGTPTITAGSFTVSPGGIDSTALLGTPEVQSGSITVEPGGIDSTALLGTPTITPDALTVSPDGIDSTVSMGTPDVEPGNFTTSPSGIDSSALLGDPTLQLQPVVAGTVFNHETGAPVGAGIEVKLFDDNDLLIGTTLTDAGGTFVFYRPFADAGLYWTLATYDVLGVQYHGVSDRGCPAT